MPPRSAAAALLAVSVSSHYGSTWEFQQSLKAVNVLKREDIQC